MGLLDGIVGFFRLLVGGWLVLMMSFGLIATIVSRAGENHIPRSDPQDFEMTIRDHPDRTKRMMSSFLASSRWSSTGERIQVNDMSDGSVRLTVPHDPARNLLEVSVKVEPLDGGRTSLVTVTFDAAGLARTQSSDTDIDDMNLAVRQELRRGLIAIDEHRVIQRGFSIEAVAAVAATHPATSD
jgi:hypothetical protein